MAEVLVLVEHVDGNVKKVTYELLALAKRIGEPAAVLVGAGADAAIPGLAEHGADRPVVVGDQDGTAIGHERSLARDASAPRKLAAAS